MRHAALEVAQEMLILVFCSADEEAVRIPPVSLSVLYLLLVSGGPSVARADRVVNANEPIVISDDLNNRIHIVHSGSDVPLPAVKTGGSGSRRKAEPRPSPPR